MASVVQKTDSQGKKQESQGGKQPQEDSWERLCMREKVEMNFKSKQCPFFWKLPDVFCHIYLRSHFIQHALSSLLTTDWPTGDFSLHVGYISRGLDSGSGVLNPSLSSGRNCNCPSWKLLTELSCPFGRSVERNGRIKQMHTETEPQEKEGPAKQTSSSSGSHRHFVTATGNQDSAFS